MTARPLRILSLGAGVQSTTLALMAMHGEIEPFDHAIFADTGAEPPTVYEHLRWLMSPNVGLPFPVHIVSAGSLRQELLDAVAGKNGAWGRPPFYLRNPDGSTGRLNRQCTEDYKIAPITAKVRELAGLRPRQRRKQVLVHQVVGISRDEVYRMKPARLPWIENRYPLVDLGMRRWDCLQWLRRHGYPEPPRSACTFCPFRSLIEWRRLRDDDPAGWLDAVNIDRAIRLGMRGVKAEALYVHRSLTPLESLDLSTAAERGQGDLWGEECTGMCGT